MKVAPTDALHPILRRNISWLASDEGLPHCGDGIPSADSDLLWGGWFVTGAKLPKVHMGNAVFDHSDKHQLTPRVDSDVVALSVFSHQMRMMNLLAHPDNVNDLVDHLLFLDETPFAAPIQGSSAFAQEFAASGPRDRQGRSLREFDLERRLMRYPCSYMIYTPSFDALPPATKDSVYRRMWCILSGEARSRLSPANRRTVVQILRDTKPDLPSYFVSW